MICAKSGRAGDKYGKIWKYDMDICGMYHGFRPQHLGQQSCRPMTVLDCAIAIQGPQLDFAGWSHSQLSSAVTLMSLSICCILEISLCRLKLCLFLYDSIVLLYILNKSTKTIFRDSMLFRCCMHLCAKTTHNKTLDGPLLWCPWDLDVVYFSSRNKYNRLGK